MPGYTVIYDGLNSRLEAGDPRPELRDSGVRYDHVSTYPLAKESLLAYLIPIRDQYSQLVRRTRYRTATQLANGETPREYIKGVSRGGRKPKNNKG